MLNDEVKNSRVSNFSVRKHVDTSVYKNYSKGSDTYFSSTLVYCLQWCNLLLEIWCHHGVISLTVMMMHGSHDFHVNSKNKS